MKIKFNKILIAIMFSIGINLFNCGNCAVLSNANLNKIIYENIYSQTSNYLKGCSDDFKINISGIPKENYSANGNFIPKVEIISQDSKFQTHSFKRVMIKDSQNRVIKSFPINVQTLVYKNVLTAKNSIIYGKEIKADDVTFERKEISNYIDKVFTQFKPGMVSTRNFQQGAIITSNYTKEKSAIIKNSVIEITFISKGIRITLQGKALKDGAIGETIPVRSDKYNKIYSGKINSENEVIVRI